MDLNKGDSEVSPSNTVCYGSLFSLSFPIGTPLDMK